MKISKISKHRFLQVRYFLILASQSLEKMTEVAYCPAGQFLVYRSFSCFSEEWLAAVVVRFEAAASSVCV